MVESAVYCKGHLIVFDQFLVGVGMIMCVEGAVFVEVGG